MKFMEDEMKFAKLCSFSYYFDTVNNNLISVVTTQSYVEEIGTLCLDPLLLLRELTNHDLLGLRASPTVVVIIIS